MNNNNIDNNNYIERYNQILAQNGPGEAFSDAQSEAFCTEFYNDLENVLRKDEQSVKLTGRVIKLLADLYIEAINNRAFQTKSEELKIQYISSMANMIDAVRETIWFSYSSEKLESFDSLFNNYFQNEVLFAPLSSVKDGSYRDSCKPNLITHTQTLLNSKHSRTSSRAGSIQGDTLLENNTRSLDTISLGGNEAGHSDQVLKSLGRHISFAPVTRNPREENYKQELKELENTLTGLQKSIAGERKSVKALKVQYYDPTNDVSRGAGSEVRTLSLGGSDYKVSDKPHYKATITFGDDIKKRESFLMENRRMQNFEPPKTFSLFGSNKENRQPLSQNFSHPISQMIESFENANKVLISIDTILDNQIPELHQKRRTIQGEEITDFDVGMPKNEELVLQTNLSRKDFLETRPKFKKIVDKATADVQAIAAEINKQSLAPIVASLEESVKELTALRYQQTDAGLDGNSRYEMLNDSIKDVKDLITKLKGLQKCKVAVIGAEENTFVYGSEEADKTLNDRIEDIFSKTDKIHSKIGGCINEYNILIKIDSGVISLKNEVLRNARQNVINDLTEKFTLAALNSHSREAQDGNVRKHGELKLFFYGNEGKEDITASMFFQILAERFAQAKFQSQEEYQKAVDGIMEILDENHNSLSANIELKNDLNNLQLALQNSKPEDTANQEALQNLIVQYDKKYSQATIERIANYDLSEQGMHNFADLAMQALRRYHHEISAEFPKNSKYKESQINPESPDFKTNTAFKVMGIYSGTAAATEKMKQVMIEMLVKSALANPEDFKNLKTSYFQLLKNQQTTKSLNLIENKFFKEFNSGHTPPEYNAETMKNIATQLVNENFKALSHKDGKPEARRAFEKAMKTKAKENRTQADTQLGGLLYEHHGGDHFAYSQNRQLRYDATSLASLDKEINSMLKQAEWRSWELRGITIDGSPCDKEYENQVLEDLENMLAYRYQMLAALNVKNKPDFVCTAGHFATRSLKGQRISMSEDNGNTKQFHVKSLGTAENLEDMPFPSKVHLYNMLSLFTEQVKRWATVMRRDLEESVGRKFTPSEDSDGSKKLAALRAQGKHPLILSAKTQEPLIKRALSHVWKPDENGSPQSRRGPGALST